MSTRMPTEERQAAIVAAALELARELSPALITTTDIAAAVGVTQGAVFKHFASKDAIWSAAMAWVRAELLSALDEAAASAASPVRSLDAVFRRHVEFVVSHPGVPRFIFHELQQPAESDAKQEVRAVLQGYRKLLLRLLGEAVQQRQVDADLDQDAAATLFVGIVQGLVMQSMLSGKPAAMRAQADRVFALYLRGIGGGMKLTRTHVRRAGAVLLGVAVLAALGQVFLRSGPLAPTRVTVVEARSGTFVPALYGIGIVEARRTYLIGPTVPGRVRRVAVDVGDRVEAGQLLAEMDPVDLDERVAALDASIARAGSVATALQAQRQDAQARRELAVLTARRYVDLGEKNFMSAGAVEARLQERASADAAVAAADANLAAARQDLQRLQAEKAGLRQQRDNVRLLAPAAGVVGRDAEAGSTVVAGQAVLRLIDPSSLWIRLRLDQGRSVGLAAALPARIVLRSNPQQPSTGRVVRVEAVSDSVTEERIAQVAFDHPPAGLAVGELAEVTLQQRVTEPALLLPNVSVRRRGDQTGVWRVDAQGPGGFVPVRLGLSSLDGQVQVLDGLKAGDRVVAYSEKALVDGGRIRIVDALPGAAP